jgi:predicted ATPase/DNA-binding SARP family transcriptional activator/Tfp pilus assembly protein PilF
MGERWRIELFGQLRATRGEQVVTRFPTRHAGALLAYLALYRDRSHARAPLAALIWPDADAPAGRHRLSQALSSLRTLLETPAETPLFFGDRERVQLNEAVVAVDLWEFTEALQHARRTHGDAERAAVLARALELYRGALLPEWCEEWLLAEREAVAEQYFGGLLEWAGLVRAAGEPSAAIEWLRVGVGLDPLREEVQRELICLLAESGQFDAARRQYWSLERLLAAELQAAPSPETRSLVLALSRADRAGEMTRAEARARCRLPSPISRFFGREVEIATLCALLEDGERLVTLTGPGGSGKTRLAIEVARQLAARSGSEARFSILQWAPLADLTEPERLSERIRIALELAADPERTPIDQLIAALADTPALLLLDNLEHLLPGAAAVLRELMERLPRLSVLTTSRRRLDLPGEQIFPVAPLPLPAHDLEECPSVQLFLDRAHGIRPRFRLTPENRGAVAEVCVRLEGLPLAIELAAARAGVLTPVQMVARLGERFDLLTREGEASGERHRSLRAAVEWSYRLLSSLQQRVLCRLSVFRGGWTLEAAEAVCGEPGVLDAIETLTSASLIHAEEQEGAMRFSMLETIREFGGESLTAEEERAVRQRHAAFYLALAEARPGCQRLEAEHDNLRAALDWAHGEDGDPGIEAGLAASLHPFWEHRGYWNEGRERLVRALLHPGAEHGTERRARMLVGAGSLTLLLRKYEEARSLLSQGLAIYTALDHKRGIIDALAWLGNVERLQQNPAGAQPLYEEALAIAQEAGEREKMAGMLALQALAAVERADWRTARSLNEQGIAIYRAIGVRRGSGWVLCNLGCDLLILGEFALARERFAEALELAHEMGHRESIAVNLQNLGSVSLHLGDRDDARRLLEESLALCEELEDTPRVADALHLLGDLTCQEGDLATARVLHERGLAIRQELGKPTWTAHSLLHLGRTVQRQEGAVAARAFYNRALSTERDRIRAPIIAGCLEGLAAVAATEADPERAVRLLSMATTLRDKSGAVRMPGEEQEYEETLTIARVALGEPLFATAWAAGQSLTLEQVFEEAMATEASDRPETCRPRPADAPP